MVLDLQPLHSCSRPFPEVSVNISLTLGPYVRGPSRASGNPDVRPRTGALCIRPAWISATSMITCPSATSDWCFMHQATSDTWAPTKGTAGQANISLTKPRLTMILRDEALRNLLARYLSGSYQSTGWIHSGQQSAIVILYFEQTDKELLEWW